LGAWWTPHERLPQQLRANFPDGAWNLGLAHGAPGAIAVLARAFAAGIRSSQPCLDRAVEWLYTQRVQGEGGALFPSLVAPGQRPAGSPLAWCYGDLGLAAALNITARNAGDAAWAAQAVAIAERAAARSGTASRVEELSFCHGLAGVAHLFNRLY